MPNRKKKLLKKNFLTSSSYTEIESTPPCKNVNSGKKTISVIKACNNYDKGGVKRILSPFNRFANNNLRIADKKKNTMLQQSVYCPSGLSPKEKAYVICSCQTRSTRYRKLKSLASTAIKENKIFSVYGSCSAVRKALLQRGWIEKIPPNRMNLTKIRNGTYKDKSEIHGELERLLLSNLVEKYNPNFIWRVKEEERESQLIDMTKDCNIIINKLRTDALWTTKQGLCSSMKRNYWFYIEDVAEVNGPRTYNSFDAAEIEEFQKDYRITACTSLLKWVLAMVANDKPVFSKTGKISNNVIIFAINRCKDYLFRKQHKDIDCSLVSPNSNHWNSFLRKYYRIIAKQDLFQEDKENKIPLYLAYAKVLLKEMHRFRPQLSCEGCHNIWIIKPAHCSRGRGIRMASKLAVITNLLNKANAKYVVQKYIEEPLLIHDTKFDIRQYYLVTSTYPLVVWMYRDCYLKFSSQKYNLKDYHESIHLTNNAIQRRYQNCTGRHVELPQNNMWELDTYKDYLCKLGKTKVWDNIIYPGMKKSIIGIMLSCQDSLTVSKNRFELYGCDFILDKDYKPWLIEINSCPDLNHTTLVTAKICPAVVSDIIKVVIDHASDSTSSTGKFECIYRQPISTPRYGGAADLSIRGFSLPLDYFYKGKLDINKSFDHPEIGKERDIKAMLQKLKQFYDSDIMVQPVNEEEECSDYENTEIIDCSHNTESENELSVAATVITEQLDEIIDGITSEVHFTRAGIKNSRKPEPDLCDVSNNKKINEKKAIDFKFSRLTDRHQGKHCNNKFISKPTYFGESSNLTQKLAKSNSDILKATSKIISFINQKEKEYFKRCFS